MNDELIELVILAVIGVIVLAIWRNSASGKQAYLDSIVQQNDQAMESTLNFIPYETYTNPFDAAGISFPISYAGGS